MSRRAKLSLLLIMVGVFIPFFFRVGWGQPVPRLGEGFFAATALIVIQELVLSGDEPGWYEKWLRGESHPKVERAGISWPAQRTDVAGLTLAFVGAVVLVLGRASAPRSGA